MKTLIATAVLATSMLFVMPAQAHTKKCTFFTVKGEKVKCFAGWKSFWYKNTHESD